jgi:hypothetical protein
MNLGVLHAPVEAMAVAWSLCAIAAAVALKSRDAGARAPSVRPL